MYLPTTKVISLVIVIVDFHTHSLASDGALEPSDLLLQAKEAGVSRFAITDHDTLAGYLSVKGSQAARDVAWYRVWNCHVVGRRQRFMLLVWVSMILRLR